MDSLLAALKNQCAEQGIGNVADAIGYARPTVSGVCNGTYAGNHDAVLTRFGKIYGLRHCRQDGGLINVEQCTQYQQPRSASPIRARMTRACQSCEFKK